MKRFLSSLAAAIWFGAATFAPAAEARADFLKLVERPRVRLSPEIEEWPATNGITQFHFSFASDPAQRVPGVLMKAEGCLLYTSPSPRDS